VGLDDVDPYEDWVRRDEALDYVIENEFDAAKGAVADGAAQDWLNDSAETLELLNIVSSYDREQLRATIRDLLNVETRVNRDASPDEYFPVAAEIAEFLERTRSPYAERYSLAESVEWVADLVDVTRTIREVLLAMSESREASDLPRKVNVAVVNPEKGSKPDQLAKLDELTKLLTQQYAFTGLGRHLDRINQILQQGVVYRLRREGRKSPHVVREIDAERMPLHTFLAFWMSQYLGTHEQYLDLTVCVECGKFFARQRRDNIYCSKTCQNRVAYKRKKIFVAGVLRGVDVKSAPDALRSGLCLNHPRFGLGVVENVQYLRRRLHLRYDDSSAVGMAGLPPMKVVGTALPIPEGKSAPQFFEEIKAREARTPVSWQEEVDRSSCAVSARFLSGVRRFSRRELDAKDVAFYEVESPQVLAELL
jgi:hypothetical protein